ncbi:MAG: Crp/Fnr family transcriptional regulator [Polyangia bacterium]|jgi:CRP/FNR family transcriptional regulator
MAETLRLRLDLDQGGAQSCTMDKAAILANCSLFQGVSPAHHRRLVEMARKAALPAGTLVFKPGDPCPGIYCVGIGSVRIYRLGASGKEHTLHLAGPGQTFAEVAVIGQFACPAYAEVTQTAQCALLPREGILAMIRDDHAFCIELLVGMSQWVRQLTGRLEDMVLRGADGRVARHLLQAKADSRGAVGLEGRKKHIASQLNLTSETYSRVLRRLVDAQVVEIVDGRRLRILDKASLQILSEQ